jgi:hypothetical protein
MANYRSAAGWRPYYVDALAHNLNILGDVRLLLPLIEQTGTNIGDVSRRNHDLTAVLNLSAFDHTGGRALRYITFDGATLFANVADHADFSFNGGGDVAFSVMAMVNQAAAETGTILSKWDVTAAAEDREWNFDMLAGVPRLTLYDETNNNTFNTVTNAALAADIWHLVVFTYDGSADVTGITPYVDGLEVAHTDTPDAGAYASMTAGLTGVWLGAHVDTAAAANIYTGSLAWVGLTAKELTDNEVWTIWSRMSAIAGL